MIRLVYPTDPNFGDAMSPLIVEKLSGQKVVPSGMWNADMMAVGSVFYRGDFIMGDLRGPDRCRYIKALFHGANARISQPVKVWGSGFLQYPPFKKPFFKRRIKVCALRGKVTRGLLDGFGLTNSSDEIPYGDPGLLFAKLFDITLAPKYDWGIIPHKYDIRIGYRARIEQTFAKCGVKVHLIDSRNDPVSVVSEIARCRRLISSSLHGLIVADSLGIPNLHVGFSTLEFPRTDFELKFRDYYSAYNEEMPPIVPGEDFLACPMKYLASNLYRRPAEGIVANIQKRLLASFPSE